MIRKDCHRLLSAVLPALTALVGGLPAAHAQSTGSPTPVATSINTAVTVDYQAAPDASPETVTSPTASIARLVRLASQATAVAPSALRIRCGSAPYTSAMLGTFHADTDYAGGDTWYFLGVPISGTADPQLYRSVRYSTSTFVYALPAAPGTYTLKLHFIEGDAQALTPGFRTFNVLVNGTIALSGLDVAAAAGGLGKPLDESIPVTVASRASGVTVGFQAISYSAMVSALELVPSSPATAPAPAPAATTVRVRAGDAYTDAAGNAWQADADYTGGATWCFYGLPVAGTADPELYRSVRYSTESSRTFGYTLPAAPGAYTLRLHFVDGDARALTPGFRTFNVLVNGIAALSNIDVAAAAGGLGKALDENIPVTVPPGGGGVTVDFQTVRFGAMVSALELVPTVSP